MQLIPMFQPRNFKCFLVLIFMQEKQNTARHRLDGQRREDIPQWQTYCGKQEPNRKKRQSDGACSTVAQIGILIVAKPPRKVCNIKLPIPPENHPTQTWAREISLSGGKITAYFISVAAPRRQLTSLYTTGAGLSPTHPGKPCTKTH